MKANDGEISLVVLASDKKNKEEACQQVRHVLAYEAKRCE